MRLINAKDLTLIEFAPNKIPDYAILSHTWTDDEVSFEEFSSPSSKSKSGYQKIVRLCRQALKDGHKYAWADTCCIDKRSSAELSEAINSMYIWYQRAVVCYVYLSDVSGYAMTEELHWPFKSSRWFTRGWTLQELLAPETVEFFSSEWGFLGSKNVLQNQISDATGIDKDILTNVKPVGSASVARRMSWASGRQTTRVEDVAYCLLGLFDINMPMLYGEGEKAFRRLQEEIMKVSADQTIFVWEHIDEELPHSHMQYSGLLAPSPLNFKNCGHFVNVLGPRGLESPPALSTYHGISINAFLTSDSEKPEKDWRNKASDSRTRGMYSAVLNCTEFNRPDRFASLLLSRVNVGDKEYIRVKQQELKRSRMRGIEQSLIVRNRLPPFESAAMKREFMEVAFFTDESDHHVDAFTAVDSILPLPTRFVAPERLETFFPVKEVGGKKVFVSDPTRHKYAIPTWPNETALLLYISLKKTIFVVSIGTDEMGQIGYDIHNGEKISEVNGKYHHMRNEVFASGYQSSLTATDLGGVAIDETCHVSLTINKVRAQSSLLRAILNRSTVRWSCQSENFRYVEKVSDMNVDVEYPP